eukprot:6154495-Prymnesium_polylepis.1
MPCPAVGRWRDRASACARGAQSRRDLGRVQVSPNYRGPRRADTVSGSREHALRAHPVRRHAAAASHLLVDAQP